jgi:hypothetical protein
VQGIIRIHKAKVKIRRFGFKDDSFLGSLE